MGVSSCLSDTIMSAEEKKLLKTEYKMESETTVPSVFESEPLEFDTKLHFEIPEETEYLRDLATEVKNGL